MTRMLRLVGGLLVCIPLAAWAEDQKPLLKKLTEADVLKLVELQIEDAVIIARLEKAGVDFKVDDAVLKRLKDAGASQEVLAALQGKKSDGATAKAGRMMVWVKRNYETWDNPLWSEFSINGKLVDTFSSDTYRPIDKYLQPGWNTITIKTTPKAAERDNHLNFRIGPMRKDAKNDRMVMEPVIWEFQNGTDWKFKDGKYSHPLGPNTKEVTLSFRVYFAGLQYERGKIREGDYVLEGRSEYSAWNTPVTATVFVNGTPMNTFILGKRDLVITPLLKQGKNEIKLVTCRVPNVLASNDVLLKVAGPAEYSVAQEGFVVKPIVQQGSLAGWERDQKTGQLVNKLKPGEETIERTITFVLDEAPQVK